MKIAGINENSRPDVDVNSRPDVHIAGYNFTRWTEWPIKYPAYSMAAEIATCFFLNINSRLNSPYIWSKPLVSRFEDAFWNCTGYLPVVKISDRLI